MIRRMITEQIIQGCVHFFSRLSLRGRNPRQADAQSCEKGPV
ncbi:hypothetical protein [Microbulbifer halophilus]